MGELFTNTRKWSFPSTSNSSLDDCNNARNGIYRNYPNTLNMPDDNSNALIVGMPVSSLFSLQLCLYQKGKLYLRMEWGANSWTSWKEY